MTREEAIKLLKQYQGYEPMFPDGETLKHAFDLTDETVDTLLSALRPVSREQVQKVWRGEWKPTEYPFMNECEDCSVCGYRTVWGHGFDFCPVCGAAQTDKAVDIIMERLEALKDGIYR